jgi:muramoyltetrapeptide carboxypeptidase
VSGSQALRSLTRPPALRPGARVAVLTCSSPADQDALADGLGRLRLAGLDPVVCPSARERGHVRPYLAGTDELRAADLARALSDPAITGVLFACGGYGAQRTLELINWDALTGLPPKVLAGYSDVTAVLEAVAARLGWTSVLGAMVAAPGEAPDYSFSSLLQVLTRPWQVRQIRYPDAIAIRGGRARGVTLGGNLSLLASSVGTPTSRPARGGILLLEDDGEADYRLDRMLTQLRRSGYLAGVAGVITGTFTRCGDRDQIEAILAERLSDLGVPVLGRANVGHGGELQAYPVGIAADLDADAGTLTLLDPPLRARKPGGARHTTAAGTRRTLES